MNDEIFSSEAHPPVAMFGEDGDGSRPPRGA